MGENEQVLDSYGTGPRGRLGGDTLSTGSSKMSPSSVSDLHNGIVKADQEMMEAKIRMHAYERYTDREERCDQHFKFYKRRVPVSSIHARKHTDRNVDKKAVDGLVLLIKREGWSERLGCITVCDDSIVPPDGPGTRVRSHLLPPTFSLVDGHLHIDALQEARKQGHSVPNNIVVDVAVPVQGTSLGDTEIRLLEMSMRLNQVAPQYPVSPQNKGTVAKTSKDFRRLMKLRSWLNASREFATLSVHTLGKGDIARVALQAVKERALEEQIQETHLQRYLRALLTFKHAPKAFEVYKRVAEKGEDDPRRLSIVTLSSSILLRADPALKVLLVECLSSHLEKRQKRFRGQQDLNFLRNIMTVYDGVTKVAEVLGYEGTSFLDTVVVLSGGENSSARRCTMRDALIAAASVRSMSASGSELEEISFRLQEALRTASTGKTIPRLPCSSSTIPSPVPRTEKPTNQNEETKPKHGDQMHEQISGEETSSMCVVVNTRRGTPHPSAPSMDTCDESSHIYCDGSEPQPQTQTQALGDLQVAEKSTGRGQKRLGASQPLSILRRKLLRRNGPLQSSGLRPGMPTSKAVKHRLTSSENDLLTTAFPACIPEDHRDRIYLSGLNVQRLRAELRACSSQMRYAHQSVFKEVHDSELGAPFLHCVQFAACWSDHRAALDEKGYTQIALHAPLLTTAAQKLMESTACLLGGGKGNLCKDPSGKKVDGAVHSANLQRINDPIFEIPCTPMRGDLEGECPESFMDQMVVQTALAVVAEWLGLYEVEGGRPSHSMSETECSLLVLPQDDKALRPRLAFGLRSYNGSTKPWDPPKDPSYMFAVTAERGFPVWIWERTHVIMHGPDELLPLIAKHTKPQLVHVEPHSIFLCRGDVVHAFGASTSERDGQRRVKPVAVLSHLVQRSVDRLEQNVSDGWWTKYISTPGS